MLIEPLEALTVKLPVGVRTLEPGTTYDLPEPQAEKLLAKAPGRVRVVEPIPTPEGVCFERNANRPDGGQPTPEGFIPAGSTVAYRSPLFGELEAAVIEDRGACVWIWHPIRECECAIPRHWIHGVLMVKESQQKEPKG
jgi:hypothetical protein